MAASGGCNSFLTLLCAGAVQNQHVSHPTAFLGVPKNNQRKMKTPHRLVVVAVTQGSAESSKSDEKIPSWAKPDSDEPPPWVRDEPNNKNSNNSQQEEEFEIPFYAYLLASAITAIAAVTNQHLILLLIIASLLVTYISFASTDRFHFRICEPKAGLRSIKLRQRVLCSLAWFFCLHRHSLLDNY